MKISEVKKNVERPQTTNTYPFSTMEVGDCFEVQSSVESIKKDTAKVRSAIGAFRKTKGNSKTSFSVLRTSDTCFGVWRNADERKKRTQKKAKVESE